MEMAIHTHARVQNVLGTQEKWVDYIKYSKSPTLQTCRGSFSRVMSSRPISLCGNSYSKSMIPCKEFNAFGGVPLAPLPFHPKKRSPAHRQVHAVRAFRPRPPASRHQKIIYNRPRKPGKKTHRQTDKQRNREPDKQITSFFQKKIKVFCPLRISLLNLSGI